MDPLVKDIYTFCKAHFFIYFLPLVSPEGLSTPLLNLLTSVCFVCMIQMILLLR